ncbi:hypothetical protein [Frondihabitans sucicola]|uniref:hypothetical protein n=1 Tax=Frondihabitans sucicola TaxID=1268041 RepID=UPI00257312B8|nr:hypothetical protein [Frondihabitans sucicola]
MFEYEGLRQDLVLAVLNGCNDLLDDIGEVRYFQEWGTRFPLAELRCLQRAAGLPVMAQRPPDPNATPPEPLRDEIAKRWEATLLRQTNPNKTSAWVEDQQRAGKHGEAITAGLRELAKLRDVPQEKTKEYQRAVQEYVVWVMRVAQRHDDDPVQWRGPAERLWESVRTRPASRKLSD